MKNVAASTKDEEVTPALLHTNFLRVIVGAFCGMLAGAVMLGLTTQLGPSNLPKLWWVHLMASLFYGGEAMSHTAGPSVLTTGYAFHFFISALCGALMGKMTLSDSVPRMAAFGLVFGAICWLASNMFAPDLFNYQALQTFLQWNRVFVFVPFGVLMGVFLGAASKVLPLT